MKILGIETSCDETAASVVEDGTILLSNSIASSSAMHEKTGGIIPEVAARQQIKIIVPVVSEALTVAGLTKNDIDAIAVTAGGPGLIGSTLVGVEAAKTFAYLWDKPIIPTVHVLSHVYANWIGGNLPEFPAIVLTVAGGHTDLLLMKGHGKFTWIGTTGDDAAGEAFDKGARLMGLPYPGGPSIQKNAEGGNPKAINFPRPLSDEDTFDFSFSGLKTALAREIQRNPNFDLPDMASSFQEAICESLTLKAVKAAEKHQVKNILVGGGVAASKRLGELLKQNSPIPVFIPPPSLCTDNATFVASSAFFNQNYWDFKKVIAIPDPEEAIAYYGYNKN